VAGAAERDVKLLAIDQFAAARGVDVDENAIDRGTLAGMGGNGIAVVEMRERLEVQLRLSPAAEPKRGDSTSRVERADTGELSIGDAELPVRQAELDAFALCEAAGFLAKDLHAVEATGIIGDGPSIARGYAQVVGIRFP